MTEDAQIAGQKFVDIFQSIHLIDPSVAMTMAISTFVSCYSIMDPPDRARTMLVIMDIINEIQSEKFEDGPDFLHFMKEKFTKDKDET
jgi:hypothetical protein